MSNENPGYQPGIRGWWRFAYRYSPRGAIKREFVTDFLRRARPSARLRQSEIERRHWQQQYELAWTKLRRVDGEKAMSNEPITCVLCGRVGTRDFYWRSPDPEVGLPEQAECCGVVACERRRHRSTPVRVREARRVADEVLS